MTKNIFTKREDLICGKIDKAEEIVRQLQNIELLELLEEIRFDAERMEQKLIYYKNKNK